MKAAILIAASGVILAVGWPSLPSFDLQAAVIVGAIVAVAAVVVIAVAIATPLIAIAGGATLLGTALAVGTIAIATGLIGGAAAGFYWGQQGDIKRQEIVETIKRVSNQLDIYFEPSADQTRAADFQCTLVIYEETDLASQWPTVTTRQVRVTAANSDEFYAQVETIMQRWFSKQVGGDSDAQPRRVKIYMMPYPGDGVYERLKQVSETNGIRTAVVRIARKITSVFEVYHPLQAGAV